MSFSTNDIYRALDSIARLLRKVDADREAEEVENSRDEVLAIISRDKNCFSSSEGEPISSDIETQLKKKYASLLAEIPFQNLVLLENALTCRSYLHENPKSGEDNERLKFLGEATIGYLVAQMLYDRYPNVGKGELTTLQSKLVKNKTDLAQCATELNLGKLARLGKGAEKQRTNPGFLSNLFEAVVGAYSLDSGIEATRNFLRKRLFLTIEEVLNSPSDLHKDTLTKTDPVSQLEKLVQKKVKINPNREPPKYTFYPPGKTANDASITCVVFINNRKYGKGRGGTREEAKVRSAEEAIAVLKEQKLT